MLRPSARHLPSLSPLAILALATWACAGPAAPPGAGGGWQRFDLWREEARVDKAAPGVRQRDTAQAVVGYLGAQEVRDLSKVPAYTFEIYPHQAAGQVRVLEQAAGSRLAWRLTLGREPYLAFTPLLDEQRPCACTFRAGVLHDGTIHELYHHQPSTPPPPAPQQVTLDLGAWAGEEVDVLLQVDGPVAGAGAPPFRVRWASPAVYSRGPAETRQRRQGPPSILLIGLDTLRADRVGALRDDPPPWAGPSLTPAIDRLAAASDVWPDAYSTFNVTNPSFVSIFTGLYGKNHGVYDLKTPLPRAHTTLAEHLAATGYATLAVISASHLGDHNSGLGQGFDEVAVAGEHNAAELAVNAAMDWIGERGGEPYFAWVHLFDPHTPHTPPQPFALGFRPQGVPGLSPPAAWVPFRSPGPVAYDQPVLAGHRDLYDGEVAYVDYQVGRLLAFLESRGLLADTLVALVADHGENLGEHGILYRHIGLWETTTRVPLMIRWPGEALRGRRLPGLVQTLDLFPTLLAAAGLPVPPQDGEDLRQLTGEGRRGRRAVFSEHASLLGVSVRTPTHRYVRSSGNPHQPDGAYLFDLVRDPGETQNLAGQGQEVETRLSALLERWLADRRPTEETHARELSPEEEARLRSLGYL